MIDNQRDIGRTSVDMGEVLRDISFPNADLDSLDVSFPDSGSAPQSRAQQKDLFAVQKRKSWDKSTEARCDFSYRQCYFCVIWWGNRRSSLWCNVRFC